MSRIDPNTEERESIPHARKRPSERCPVCGHKCRGKKGLRDHTRNVHQQGAKP